MVVVFFDSHTKAKGRRRAIAAAIVAAAPSWSSRRVVKGNETPLCFGVGITDNNNHNTPHTLKQKLKEKTEIE